MGAGDAQRKSAVESWTRTAVSVGSWSPKPSSSKTLGSRTFAKISQLQHSSERSATSVSLCPTTRTERGK